MRLSPTAVTLSICVSLVGLAAVGSAGDPTKSASPRASPALTAPTSAAVPDAAASDAAARHAKRTACVKQAKARKLVGAEKNSFIKNCVAAH